jgi:hypothetical protein
LEYIRKILHDNIFPFGAFKIAVRRPNKKLRGVGQTHTLKSQLPVFDLGIVDVYAAEIPFSRRISLLSPLRSGDAATDGGFSERVFQAFWLI